MQHDEIELVMAQPWINPDGTITVVVGLRRFDQGEQWFTIESIIPEDMGCSHVQTDETDTIFCGQSSMQSCRERETARVLADYGEDAALEHVRNGRP